MAGGSTQQGSRRPLLALCYNAAIIARTGAKRGAMRILIADDSSDAREILARLLKRWGHEVVAADNGREAWEILAREPIRLVISDWMMPYVDGLELCRRVRAAGFDHYVYFILLTAREEKEDLIEGMTAGADDFLTKSFSFKELQVRLRAAERILTLEGELAARNQELHEKNAALETALGRIERDLRAAALLQESLLPKHAELPGGLGVDWLLRPAAVIGGDIFNFFTLHGRVVGFYLLDVAGHGVPSAMMSVSLSRSMTALRGDGLLLAGGGGPQAPDRVVADLNRRFQSDDIAPYFTMVYGYLDGVTGRGALCQAGHPYPLLSRADGRCERLGQGGFAVGMFDDVPYDSVPFALAPGDRLILYSDGVTDCRSPAGEEFGLERLRQAAVAHHEAPLAALGSGLDEALARWRGRGEIEDDISLLVFERR